MLQEMEQSFTALSSRDKMKFLRWAAESVGARLNTVFGDTHVAMLGDMVDPPHPFTVAEIPEFLKRKK